MPRSNPNKWSSNRKLGGQSIGLTVDDLAKLPHHTVKTTDHGLPVSFEGVLLADVLAKVDAPTGEAHRSTAASYYVLVEAKDGYRAVFAWAELDPSFTERKVYLVTKRDGKLRSAETKCLRDARVSG